MMLSDTMKPAPEGMVLIPAGSFEMGSDAKDASPEEQPVHTVHLDAFYIDIYEVTNAQFKAFVDANPNWQKDNSADKFHDEHYLSDWNSTDYPAGKANHPVVWVSWYAAMAYAQWADKRLPTEAEWEYAARGGHHRKTYPWGNDEPPLHRSNWHAACLTAHFTRERQKNATYEETAKGFILKKPPGRIENAIKSEKLHLPAVANYHSHFGGTTPVGCFPANGYGLYDMAGNVWEWCLDQAVEDFYKKSDNHQNPIAGGKVDTFKTIPADSMRILRGGTCRSSARFLQVARRGGNRPASTNAVCGFRCVQDAR